MAGYMYKGVELVNCSPPKRKGPFTHFPYGEHKGERVENVIRKNPRYVMWAVKEWLDLTPSQAGLFEAVTGGGIIPDRYIKESPPKVISPIRERLVIPPRVEERRETNTDIPSWEGVDCTWPNLGFEPELAPEWWNEFLEKIKGLTGAQAKWLFEDYRRKELKQLQKLWNE